MPTSVYHRGKLIGTIHDLDFDDPHWFGRWEPASPEVDAWVRSEIARDGEPIIVRFDDSQNEHYISCLEGTEIDLRLVYNAPPKWWEFWLWSGLCDL
ncbi:MAG: hypothetical protein K8R36_10215 [Planctomycetales bacterium]|nr:hypothetical protein [Planctomycetales bacterium]